MLCRRSYASLQWMLCWRHVSRLWQMICRRCCACLICGPLLCLFNLWIVRSRCFTTIVVNGGLLQADTFHRGYTGCSFFMDGCFATTNICRMLMMFVFAGSVAFGHLVRFLGLRRGFFLILSAFCSLWITCHQLHRCNSLRLNENIRRHDREKGINVVVALMAGMSGGKKLELEERCLKVGGGRRVGGYG